MKPKKLEKTYVFRPTKFERSKQSRHITASKAFYDLLTRINDFVNTLDIESDWGPFCNGIPAGVGSEHFGWKNQNGREAIEINLPPGIAEAANDLYYAILERLQDEYEKGLSDGTDLLRRLASGDITIKDVDAVKHPRISRQGEPK